MIHDPNVVAARARALSAKVQLDTSLRHAKSRLNPRSLAADAVDNAADRAMDAAQSGVQIARERPAVAAAAVGAIGLLLARRPILRLFGFGRSADDGTGDDTANSQSSNDKD